jgi:putative membrane protein
MHAAHAGEVGGSPALLVLLVVLPAILLGFYLFAVARERKTSAWSGWRTLSFTAGAVLIIVAMVPPVADWAHRDLRGHMIQHLLLGMFAPLGLVLGAPGILLLRNLPAAGARRMVALLGTLPARLLIHPVTAALLDIGGMYVLYLTPLYALSLSDPLLQGLLHVHFVVSGYLFTWSIAGPDPAPHRPRMLLRLAVLFLATAAHASLGKVMYGYGHPRGTLAEPDEIRAAAQWMYYGGDLAELLLAAAFFTLWFRRRTGLPSMLAEPAAVARPRAYSGSVCRRAGLPPLSAGPPCP